MFLATRDIDYEYIQFDVIEVYITEDEGTQLRHMKGCKL